MANATRTGERPHEVVRLRISPSLMKKVTKRAAQRGTSKSALLRELVEEQLERSDTAGDEKPRLTRSEYAQRAAGLVEAFGDILTRVERHDPEGALLLLQGLKRAVNDYEADLLGRTET